MKLERAYWILVALAFFHLWINGTDIVWIDAPGIVYALWAGFFLYHAIGAER